MQLQKPKGAPHNFQLSWNGHENQLILQKFKEASHLVGFSPTIVQFRGFLFSVAHCSLQSIIGVQYYGNAEPHEM